MFLVYTNLIFIIALDYIHDEDVGDCVLGAITWKADCDCVLGGNYLESRL